MATRLEQLEREWRKRVGANAIGLPIDRVVRGPLLTRRSFLKKAAAAGTLAALPGITWMGSPNYTPGRPVVVDRVVIHTMVGWTSSANTRFQNPAQQVSAHYGVSLDGSICQWVDEGDIGWHAGEWDVNCRSIGIEHEDGGDYNGPRTPEMYFAANKLVRDICERHGLGIDRITILEHRQVHATACPDSLDVDRIMFGGEDEMPTEAEWKQHLEVDAARDNTLIAIKGVLGQLAHAKHPEHVLGASTRKAIADLDTHFANLKKLKGGRIRSTKPRRAAARRKVA